MADDHQVPYPTFNIPAENVQVLYTPQDFYNHLRNSYASAKNRIILAALYIGTGILEREMIDVIASAASRRNHITVDVIVDAARGRRMEKDGKSSLSMLAPLLELQTSNGYSYNKDHSSHNSTNVIRSNNASVSTTDCSDTDDSSSFSSETTVPAIQRNRRICLGLFHSPLLSGLLYHVLPPRINEILGVFHTKVFLVDNSVVLTGANLSEQYLVDRQDRYIVIRDCPELADALYNLVQLLQKFSLQATFSSERDDNTVLLDDGREVTLRLSPSVPSPIEYPYLFSSTLGTALIKYLKDFDDTNRSSDHDSCTLEDRCTVYMAVQAGFATPSIQQEEDLLRLVLGHSKAGANFVSSLRDKLHRWRRGKRQTRAYSRPGSSGGPTYQSLDHIILASGYLNMTDELLMQLNSAEEEFEDDEIDPNGGLRSLEVFMAAPEANSFHESRGPSKYIPMAYSYVGAEQMSRLTTSWSCCSAKRYTNGTTWFSSLTLWLLSILLYWLPFNNNNSSSTKYTPTTQEKPKFWEFKRPSWTFHSKGVWLYGRDHNKNDCPFGTVIGSSNFGLRSRIRDLDVSFLITTDNEELQRQFEGEIDVMRSHSYPADDAAHLARRCPGWLRVLLRWSRLKTLL